MKNTAAHQKMDSTALLINMFTCIVLAIGGMALSVGIIVILDALAVRGSNTLITTLSNVSDNLIYTLSILAVFGAFIAVNLILSKKANK